jgi:hypothetical protein
LVHDRFSFSYPLGYMIAKRWADRRRKDPNGYEDRAIHAIGIESTRSDTKPAQTDACPADWYLIRYER